MASSSFFTNGTIKRPRYRYHTPTTFRAQKRLLFPDPSTIHSKFPPASTELPLSPPGVSPPRQSFSRPAISTANNDKIDSANSNLSSTQQLQLFQHLQLPWDTPGAKSSSLYKSAPPNLTYPSGSQDEAINDRFMKRMDMYLFQNFQVRSILVGERPHPFAEYPRLNQYWAVAGDVDWKFDSSTTFAMLEKIKSEGHTDFHHELTELLWFGGVLSYGNIMRETYAIMYSWIAAVDLPDIEGLCEADDGINFRIAIKKSLRVVRVKHTHEIISRLYTKLDENKLIMRPRGMSAYFARMNKIRLDMKKHGEILSEAFLLRTTKLAVASKHKTLKDAMTEMRKIAGTSGKPTNFVEARETLIDIFDFEIPSAEKTEKLPTVSANIARDDRDKDKRKRDENFRQKRRSRAPLPKGSCKHCPNSTSHHTSECYVTIRKQMGLPNGWQWCTRHEKGTHYEHLCRRHHPNYPTPPKIIPAAVCTPCLRPQDLTNRVLSMIGAPQQTSPQPQPQQHKSVKKTGIVITPSDAKSQNFRQACDVSTNVATNGPPVNNMVSSIMALSEQDRGALAQLLADAGF